MNVNELKKINFPFEKNGILNPLGIAPKAQNFFMYKSIYNSKKF